MNRRRRHRLKSIRFGRNLGIRFQFQNSQRSNDSEVMISSRLNPLHTDAIRIWFEILNGSSDLLNRPVQNLQYDLNLFRLEDDSRTTMQRFIKRSIDVIGSIIGMIFLSPFILMIACVIKLTSPGPVFFIQERVGKGGRFFRMFKFRTMIEDAEDKKSDLMSSNEMSGPVFKIKSDPRVTPFGRILRRHSLDELPQLLNVLKGDMSLVGPRPALPEEVMAWKIWQTRRLSVDQGLTCLWQISGRNHVPFERWMQLDLEYIDYWSLRLDFNILVKTVLVVITGKGAY